MNENSEGPVSLSLQLVKVRELAQRGRFKDAQDLLAPDASPPQDPTRLHALAAVVTQAGDYPRALSLWRLLLQRDPQHAEARDLIAIIETWTSRPPWFRFLPLGAGAAAVLLLGAVWWAFARPGPAPRALSPTVSSPAIRPIPAPSAANASTTAPRPAAPRPAATPTTGSEPPPVRIQVFPPPTTKKN